MSIGDARDILTFIFMLRYRTNQKHPKQRQTSHACSLLCYLAVSGLKIRDNTKCQFTTSVPYSPQEVDIKKVQKALVKQGVRI